MKDDRNIWCVVGVLAQYGCRHIIQVDAAHWWWLRRSPPLCEALWVSRKVLYKCNELINKLINHPSCTTTRSDEMTSSGTPGNTAVSSTCQIMLLLARTHEGRPSHGRSLQSLSRESSWKSKGATSLTSSSRGTLAENSCRHFWLSRMFISSDYGLFL